MYIYMKLLCITILKLVKINFYSEGIHLTWYVESTTHLCSQIKCLLNAKSQATACSPKQLKGRVCPLIPVSLATFTAILWEPECLQLCSLWCWSVAVWTCLLLSPVALLNAAKLTQPPVRRTCPATSMMTAKRRTPSAIEPQGLHRICKS